MIPFDQCKTCLEWYDPMHECHQCSDVKHTFINRQTFIVDENGHEIPIEDISKLSKGDVFRMESIDEFDPIDKKQQWKAIRAPLKETDGTWQIECQPYPLI